MNVPRLTFGTAVSLAAAVYLVACFLPGEPDGGRLLFTFDFQPPYRVPLAGDGQPPIRIAADGQVLQNPSYRLVSLEPSRVRVDSTGRGLQGIARGTAVVRVSYQTAAGTVDTVFSTQVVVSRVAVDSPALAFTRLGARSRLRAIAFDAQEAVVPNVAFTWSSANPRVATVDDTGLVAAVDEGTVVITAKADSVEGFASAVVTQVASQVRLAPEIDTLYTVTHSTQFIAIAFDDSGRVLRLAKPRWSTSDTNVALVDFAGIATASGGGTARIIARVGTAADTATLVVKQVAAFVHVTPSVDTLTAIQDTGRIVATAYDSGVPTPTPIPNAAVTWETSDPTVATVNSTGLVTAAANGVILVTATSDGLSGFATVVVRQQVAAVRLSLDHVALAGRGDTVRLSAVGVDRNGHDVVGAGFTWRTGSGFVATVDASGLVTARGGGSTSITATPADGGTSGAATVTVTGAPRADVIVFDSPRGIEVMLVDGSQRTLLIQNPPATWYSQPSWSPDGSRLAFIRNSCDVVTARVDGSDLRVVNVGNPVCNESPVWSPDGTKIAFTQGDCWDYETAIYVANVDGSNRFRLTTAWCAFSPTWSPDGTKLAFADDWGEKISVVNNDGTGLRSLISKTYGGLSEPAWSPDGSQIAFVEAYGDPNTVHGTIWVMDADGSGAQNLTEPVTQAPYNRSPTWSPDGSIIAFARSSDLGSSDLYLIGPDGLGLQRLTATGDAFNPAWRQFVPAANAGRVALPRAKATTGARPAPER